MSEVVVRRVRLELPIDTDIVSPFREQLAVTPYAAWLCQHVEEVFSLISDDGEKLLAGIWSTRVESSTGSSVFVTDFCFANHTQFDYYNTKFVATMRGRITDSYPGAFDSPDSPFKYKIGVLGTMDGISFDSLRHTPGEIESVETLAMLGSIPYL